MASESSGESNPVEAEKCKIKQRVKLAFKIQTVASRVQIAPNPFVKGNLPAVTAHASHRKVTVRSTNSSQLKDDSEADNFLTESPKEVKTVKLVKNTCFTKQPVKELLPIPYSPECHLNKRMNSDKFNSVTPNEFGLVNQVNEPSTLKESIVQLPQLPYLPQHLRKVSRWDVPSRADKVHAGRFRKEVQKGQPFKETLSESSSPNSSSSSSSSSSSNDSTSSSSDCCSSSRSSCGSSTTEQDGQRNLRRRQSSTSSSSSSSTQHGEKRYQRTSHSSRSSSSSSSSSSETVKIRNPKRRKLSSLASDSAAEHNKYEKRNLRIRKLSRSSSGSSSAEHKNKRNGRTRKSSSSSRNSATDGKRNLRRQKLSRSSSAEHMNKRNGRRRKSSSSSRNSATDEKRNLRRWKLSRSSSAEHKNKRNRRRRKSSSSSRNSATDDNRNRRRRRQKPPMSSSGSSSERDDEKRNYRQKHSYRARKPFEKRFRAMKDKEASHRQCQSDFTELFVILRSDSRNEMSPLEVLETSAKFSKTELSFNEGVCTDGKFVCSISIAGKRVVCVFGTCTDNARNIAAGEALVKLRSQCCSILIKELNTAGYVVSSEQLCQDDLLRRLVSKEDFNLPIAGWSTHGRNRIQSENDALQRIALCLQAFRRGEDLVVLPEMSANVETMIFKIAERAKCLVSELRSSASRYIILSRLHSVSELIDSLRADDGETEHCFLFEPMGEWRDDDEDVDAIFRLATFVTDHQQSSSPAWQRSNEVAFLATAPCVSRSSTTIHFFADEEHRVSAEVRGPSLPVGHRAQLPFVELKKEWLSSVGSWLKTDTSLLHRSVVKHLESAPRVMNCSGDTLGFVIVRMQSCSDCVLSPIAVLDISTWFCHSLMTYSVFSRPDDFRCCVSLNSVMIGQAVGKGEFEAMMSAAYESLCYLSTFCPTIVIMNPLKQRLSSDEDLITPNQLTGRRRRGTELSETEKKSLTIFVDNLLSRYAKDPHHSDLIFSPTFTSLERSFIHNMAQQRGFGTYRCGMKIDLCDQSCLMVGRRRDPFEIVEHVRANSGKTLRYRLFEPHSVDG